MKYSLIAVLFILIASLGCTEQDRAERRQRAAPLVRHELQLTRTDAPFRIFSSRVGRQVPGRSHSLLIGIQLTRGVLSITSEVSGVAGVTIIGGRRLNHASASRTRLINRPLSVEIAAQSQGHARIDIGWRSSIDGGEERVQVVLPLTAQDAAVETR